MIELTESLLALLAVSAGRRAASKTNQGNIVATLMSMITGI
jgi:hypothetical protein